MTKKILIIDDDPIIVKYLSALFKDNGYDTCVADSGLAGMDVLKKENPDMITLDLQMPEEWGSRFYRKLRKTSDFKDIPIIVVTGLDGRHAIQNAVSVIRKPFDPDVLIKTVEQTIGPAI